ncbi:NUDIX hydrolase [Clostridium sp. BJN0001]|uniref:NUDIX hydrolase n=1 Tax=Clostridium sp. BJN0001 TaxID=2930219 RepID=UPI001FD4C89B|nr:NUDIX hydrolase [Clostridium sp. BJN0001]
MHNLIAHALVQNKKGEILIIRRTLVERGKKNFEAGKWDIPGGTVGSLNIVLNLEEHDDYKWVSKSEILKLDDSKLVSYMKEAVKLLK